MLRFQGEEYRAPSSLHTTRKVAQKDPIFPPWDNPNFILHTTTRCKRNINISNTRTHNSNIFYIRQIYVLISSWKEGMNRYFFLPFPFTPYVITICFMNRILLFSNDD